MQACAGARHSGTQACAQVHTHTRAVVRHANGEANLTLWNENSDQFDAYYMG